MDDFFPDLLMNPDPPPPGLRGKKKKTDLAALQSPFMRVPHMRVEIARALMDCGFRQLYELQGRSPETIFEQMRAKKAEFTPKDLSYIRLAVYCAEHAEAERDREKLHPHAWN